jgi:hypothetical protein
MNRALFPALCGALLLPALVAAQATAPTTATTVPEEKGPPKQEAVSGGTLPDDLLGRWLVVGWIGIKDSEHAKTTTGLWEFTREDAQIVFSEAYLELPPRITNLVTEANSDDKAWRPTPEDLAEIQGAWDKLPVRDPQIATQRNEVYGKDAFDPDFKSEAQTKDSIWAARQTGIFRKKAAPSVRSINVFGATEARDGGYAGNYTAATIAAAPFPIPIKLEGKFQMYRVSGPVEAPKKSFWSSLFSGCARK